VWRTGHGEPNPIIRSGSRQSSENLHEFVKTICGGLADTVGTVLTRQATGRPDIEFGIRSSGIPALGIILSPGIGR